MLFILTDLRGASARLAEEGEALGLIERDTRMRQITEKFMTTSGIVVVGPPTGDGWFMVGPDEVGVEAFQRSLELQAIPSRLPARLALVIGPGHLTGPLGDPRTTVQSTMADRAGRLRDLCPPGEIVINEGLYVELSPYPDLLRALRPGGEPVRTFGGLHYWLARPGGGEGLVAFTEQHVTEVQGQLLKIAEDMRAMESRLLAALDERVPMRRFRPIEIIIYGGMSLGGFFCMVVFGVMFCRWMRWI